MLGLSVPSQSAASVPLTLKRGPCSWPPTVRPVVRLWCQWVPSAEGSNSRRAHGGSAPIEPSSPGGGREPSESVRSTPGAACFGFGVPCRLVSLARVARSGAHGGCEGSAAGTAGGGRGRNGPAVGRRGVASPLIPVASARMVAAGEQHRVAVERSPFSAGVLASQVDAGSALGGIRGERRIRAECRVWLHL